MSRCLNQKKVIMKRRIKKKYSFFGLIKCVHLHDDTQCVCDDPYFYQRECFCKLNPDKIFDEDRNIDKNIETICGQCKNYTITKKDMKNYHNDIKDYKHLNDRFHVKESDLNDMLVNDVLDNLFKFPVEFNKK